MSSWPVRAWWWSPLLYRLNVFGFSAHAMLEKEAVDGRPCANFGFLDQRMGIQWVKDNIALFGGDPGEHYRVRPVRRGRKRVGAKCLADERWSVPTRHHAVWRWNWSVQSPSVVS